MTADRYIGLISGTSRDGLDAVLVDFQNDTPRLLEATCTPYPEALRADLDRLIRRGRRPRPGEAATLDQALGRFFADACHTLLRSARVPADTVRAIGSHGQTVWHEPTGPDPVSLQLGDAGVLARETGITVVADFRTADVEAGGQGAPLAPLLHRGLFAAEAPCAVLNLGGIANLTLLGGDGEVAGFDTGPANCLMDGWCLRQRGEAFDRGGAWAATGQVLANTLDAWLADPFFALPPPKSTGLQHFNLAWLDARLDGGERPADVQRTLLALTVDSVATALEAHPLGGRPGPLLLCGGGAHNHFLVRQLTERLPERTIETTEPHGIHPDWVEAILFAWLAKQRLDNRSLETAPITGAGSPVLLGRITPANELGATA